MRRLAALCAIVAAVIPACVSMGCQTDASQHSIADPDSKKPRVLDTDLDGMSRADLDGLYAYAPSQEQAREMLLLLRYSAKGFDRVFGDTPRPAALLIGSATSEAHESRLRQDGCRVVLSLNDWMPMLVDRGEGSLHSRVRDEMVEMYLEFPTMRAYLKECGDEQGCIDEVRSLLRASADEQARTYLAQLAAPMNPEQLIPHELGHLLFIERFWPGAWYDGTHRYGGPAHDWLDEVAAVLLEPPLLTATRRANAADAFTTAALPTSFVPLNKFFTMTHPSFDPDATLDFEAHEHRTSGFEFTLDYVTLDMEHEGVTVSRRMRLDPEGSLQHAHDGDQDGVHSGPDTSTFYTQCRSLIDFIETRADPERVWRSIAEKAAGGGTMQTWLGDHGSEHGLPASVLELEREWIAWASEQEP